MKKIFIATPAFSGQVTVPYALSLAELTLALKANNYDVIPQIVTSGSLLVAERNRLTEAFWQSGCDYMLCIDSDLGYPAQAVLAMLEQNKEFICGIYPARGQDLNAFTFRPVKNEDESLITDNHLIKMEYIPAGFMLISRSAIEKMRNKYPELCYCPKYSKDKSESAYCFFDTEIFDGEFWGEDYVFSRRAREAGIDIWCDPLIEFDHAGTRGMLLNVLRTKDGKEITLGKEQ